MTIAKRRPRCSTPISSRMNGNFCTVVMMIFLPLSMNLRRSPERSAWPTVAPTWANCLMVSRICWSRMRRSVTTMTESKTHSVVLLQSDELVGQPSNGVRLAAACRVLDEVTLARAVLLSIGQQLPDDVKLVIPRKDLLSSSSCRSSDSSLTIWA